MKLTTLASSKETVKHLALIIVYFHCLKFSNDCESRFVHPIQDIFPSYVPVSIEDIRLRNVGLTDSVGLICFYPS